MENMAELWTVDEISHSQCVFLLPLVCAAGFRSHRRVYFVCFVVPARAVVVGCGLGLASCFCSSMEIYEISMHSVFICPTVVHGALCSLCRDYALPCLRFTRCYFSAVAVINIARREQLWLCRLGKAHTMDYCLWVLPLRVCVEDESMHFA